MWARGVSQTGSPSALQGHTGSRVHVSTQSDGVVRRRMCGGSDASVPHLFGITCIAMPVLFGKELKRLGLRRRAKGKCDASILSRIAEIYRNADEVEKANRWSQYLASAGLEPSSLSPAKPAGRQTKFRPYARGFPGRVPLQRPFGDAAVDTAESEEMGTLPVPTGNALEGLRAWQSSASDMSCAAMSTRILQLCKEQQPHLAEVCLRPLLQAMKVPHATAKVIAALTDVGKPGLLRADDIMQQLVDMLHRLPVDRAKSVEAVIVDAGPKLVERALREGCSWLAERWLAKLLQRGYKGSLRGQLCEHLAKEDVLKAESWMVSWVRDYLAGAAVSEPKSRHIAALCWGFLKNRSTYYKVTGWMELAAEVGISLDVIDFERLLERLVRSTRFQERPYIMRSLISSLVSNKHLHLAEKLADLSITYGIAGVETVSALMAQLARHGREDMAMSWIDELLLRRLTPDAQSFTICIDASARRDVSVASELLATMEAQQVEPNCFVYSTVINACAEVDSAVLAVTWLDCARISALQPNSYCYNAVLKAHARCQELDAAAGFLADMSVSRVTPDTVSYNSVISASAGTGMKAVLNAEGFFHQMQVATVMPNLITYANLIHVAAKSGDVNKAESWHGRMVSAGFSPSPQTVRMLMNAAATSGDVPRAELWWKALTSIEMPQQLEYNTLMKAYAKTNQIQKAEQLYVSMLQYSKPSEVTFGILMEGRASVGHIEGVRYWQDRFQETGGDLNLVMYNLLLKACGVARPKQGSEAEATLRLMVHNAVQPNFITLRTLASSVGEPAAKDLCNNLHLDWDSLLVRQGQGASLPLRSADHKKEVQICK